MAKVIFPAAAVSKKIIFIDFEFNHSNEASPHLVCATLHNLKSGRTKDFWLATEMQKQILRATLKKFGALEYAFCAYNVVAEARCFLALGLDPVGFEWIDLMLEHRQLTNCYERLGYGKQLSSSGKPIFTKNVTKWGKTEEQLAQINRSKPVCSLNSAIFKFLEIMPDVQTKKDVTALILQRGKSTFSPSEAKRVMKYCRSDVALLPDLFRAMLYEYVHFWKTRPRHMTTRPLDLDKAMRLRGRYAALTADMVSRGYPVHKLWLNNFLQSVPKLYQDVRRDIAAQFEEFPPFVPKAKTIPERGMRFSMNNVRAWIREKSGYADRWPLTETGALSLASGAWQKFYGFKHDYPEGNYAAQVMRWNSFKKSMAGFAEGVFKESKILEYYDQEDGRVRPYMNPYGSQTARSQPKATSFIPLKTAWSRALIYQEDPSKFLCSIDYGSQEVLIQAIISGDSALYGSYTSGDVYLDFAKRAGAVPRSGTKKTHAGERTVYKTAFLAIGYGVGAKTLAAQISSATGKPCSEDTAFELIEQFYEVYHRYKGFLDAKKSSYGFKDRFEPPTGKGFLSLPCGWMLMPNNLSSLSVGNFLIQGAGSSIMREAVWLCYKAKLPVVYTLHDALTCELENPDQISLFKKQMHDAFINVMRSYTYNPKALEWAEAIRLDVNCWGEYFKAQTWDRPDIKQQVLYLDERAERTFKFYSKYFMGAQGE
jgi:hypothetical protein